MASRRSITIRTVSADEGGDAVVNLEMVEAGVESFGAAVAVVLGMGVTEAEVVGHTVAMGSEVASEADVDVRARRFHLGRRNLRLHELSSRDEFGVQLSTMRA
jgi:hypothetical protein